MRSRPRFPWLKTVIFTALISVNAFAATEPRLPGELAWSMRYDPKTFDPAQVDDEASEMVRFLTGGVLLRINRQTQQPEPELAAAWSLSADGRVLLFRLRENLHFSDGSALTAQDVAWSLRRVLASATAAPIAEEFLSPQEVSVETVNALSIRVRLPKRIVGIAKIIDQIAIEPMDRPGKAKVTSGPFTVSDYERGRYLRLHRNPYYWKRDSAGIQLPYAANLRIDILSSREQEISRFKRGEYDFVESFPPEYFATVSKALPTAMHDLGPSLNTEQMWFNQDRNAPLPDFEKAWFQNRSFRSAVSQAIHRADLAKIAYNGFATPAYGFISPANSSWYNTSLQYPQENLTAALQLLAKAGFQKKDGILYDASGHPVRFSILTNAGNGARQKMATLIQQDLAALGMEITIVTLDFPALIDRIMHTQAYQACLLGLVNVDPDPNSMANLWLSSSPTHQWNPSEKSPATSWEAEIDAQILLQATSRSDQERKRAFDRVQQIVATEQPFIYLVYPNALSAASPKLIGVQPLVFQPGLLWNIDIIHPRKEN